MTASELLNSIVETYPEESILKADGFDEAILGIDEEGFRLIYSISKVLSILVADGMTEEDALEYFSFNIRGAYVGEKTPIWCDDVY